MELSTNGRRELLNDGRLQSIKLTTNGRRELLNDIQLSISCLNDTFVVVNNGQLCKINHIAAMIAHDVKILEYIIECLHNGGYEHD